MEVILIKYATIFVVVAVALTFSGAVIFAIIRAYKVHTEQYEPKSNPALHKEYATKAELEKTEAGVEKLSIEMKDGFEKIRDASGKSRTIIYDSVNATGKEVAALTRSDEIRGGQLIELGRKIDKLLER